MVSKEQLVTSKVAKFHTNLILASLYSELSYLTYHC